MLHLTQFYTNKRGIMNLLCKSVTCKGIMFVIKWVLLIKMIKFIMYILS